MEHVPSTCPNEPLVHVVILEQNSCVPGYSHSTLPEHEVPSVGSDAGHSPPPPSCATVVPPHAIQLDVTKTKTIGAFMFVENAHDVPRVSPMNLSSKRWPACASPPPNPWPSNGSL